MSRFLINTLRVFLLSILIFWNTPNAQSVEDKTTEIKNFDAFGSLAVQDEGRIKPLETYARTVLLQFSGKRTFEKKPAIAWLAKVLFTPEKTVEDKIFLINSPDIATAIGIEPDRHRRYSFSQLKNGLAKIKKLAIAAEGIEAKNRDIVDQEIIRLYNNLSLYLNLRSSFSFATPDPAFFISLNSVRSQLNFPSAQNDFSFLDIALRADIINEETKILEKKKSENWGTEEKELMRLLRNLYQWSQNAGATPLLIMPSVNINDERWLSPWEMIQKGFTKEESRKQLTYLRDIAVSYQAGHQLDFNIAAKAYNESIEKNPTPGQRKSLQKIPYENFYNHANFFFLSWCFYLLAFFGFLFSLIWPREALRKLAFGFLICGLIPHVTAMALRIYIMSRPPVTNLYETFIFVGVVTVVLGILTELTNKKWLGIVAGSIAGFIFLAIADKYSAEGDTLRMLVAVLNSNFWLSTHVLSITIGYSGCCLAAILGHVYILQALLRPRDKESLQQTYRHILGILGFGLTMSFLGTMLGGIWADQSWGRFWGWDPKENGALLIVLWTAIIFHAKVAKRIESLGVAVGAVLGGIVVMWAWFGVNLLNIGLHSYGFTSGIAMNLAIYVCLEIVFLSVSVIILGRRGVAI